MPAPTTLKAQKRVIGMFSYHGKFINNFSEKICALNHNFKFPLPEHILKVFQSLKDSIKDTTLIAIDQNKDFQVETDTNDFYPAGILCQEGRPVAFFSPTLSKSECCHHAVEKEAAAIVEALCHWRYLLLR